MSNATQEKTAQFPGMVYPNVAWGSYGMGYPSMAYRSYMPYYAPAYAGYGGLGMGSGATTEEGLKQEWEAQTKNVYQSGLASGMDENFLVRQLNALNDYYTTRLDRMRRVQGLFNQSTGQFSPPPPFLGGGGSYAGSFGGLPSYRYGGGGAGGPGGLGGGFFSTATPGSAPSYGGRGSDEARARVEELRARREAMERVAETGGPFREQLEAAFKAFQDAAAATSAREAGRTMTVPDPYQPGVRRTVHLPTKMFSGETGWSSWFGGPSRAWTSMLQRKADYERLVRQAQPFIARQRTAGETMFGADERAAQKQLTRAQEREDIWNQRALEREEQNWQLQSARERAILGKQYPGMSISPAAGGSPYPAGHPLATTGGMPPPPRPHPGGQTLPYPYSQKPEKPPESPLQPEASDNYIRKEAFYPALLPGLPIGMGVGGAGVGAMTAPAEYMPEGAMRGLHSGLHAGVGSSIGYAGGSLLGRIADWLAGHAYPNTRPGFTTYKGLGGAFGGLAGTLAGFRHAKGLQRAKPWEAGEKSLFQTLEEEMRGPSHKRAFHVLGPNEEEKAERLAEGLARGGAIGSGVGAVAGGAQGGLASWLASGRDFPGPVRLPMNERLKMLAAAASLSSLMGAGLGAGLGSVYGHHKARKKIEADRGILDPARDYLTSKLGSSQTFKLPPSHLRKLRKRHSADSLEDIDALMDDLGRKKAQDKLFDRMAEQAARVTAAA